MGRGEEASTNVLHSSVVTPALLPQQQHQGCDNGTLGSYWSTELSHAKAPEGVEEGEKEFTGWNSHKGDYSVWLQHFNKSFRGKEVRSPLKNMLVRNRHGME